MRLKDDANATPQSLIVVALAGCCYGFGFTVFFGADPSGILLGIAGGLVTGLVLAFLWVSLTFLVGSRLLGGTRDYWGLARPFFFAWSPGVLFLFMSIPDPLVSAIFRGVTTGWIAIASVIAVKYGMGLDNQRSLLTFVLVFLVMAIAYRLVISL